MARPVPLAMAKVSHVHCAVEGEHASPVSAEEPAVEMRKAVSVWRVISCTAMATDEVGTSTTATTFCESIQVRASVEPTSGLFWWSPTITSTVSPSSLPPKSSTAICAATTAPWPARSKFMPDMSVRTPMR
jgi:hypothetical protein